MPRCARTCVPPSSSITAEVYYMNVSSRQWLLVEAVFRALVAALVERGPRADARSVCAHEEQRVVQTGSERQLVALEEERGPSVCRSPRKISTYWSTVIGPSAWIPIRN